MRSTHRGTIALMPDASTAQIACDVAVLVDEEVGEPDAQGRFVLERGTMEWYVLQTLEQQHENVCVVPFDPEITSTIAALRGLNPSLVFNLTEWVAGDRRLDSAIAGMLEMMKLRYTGAGPEGMQLARDKALAKQVVSDLGFAVAPHTIVNGRRPDLASMSFPLIVKPQFGDGSDEIANGALVHTERELMRRVESVRRRTQEPLMCEQFVGGRDLFVALLGNSPRVMPALELVVGRQGATAPRFATSRVKTDARYRTKWRIRYREARLPQDVAQCVIEASKEIFRALKLRDYARIDYRLTPENQLVFLEANPNPDLTRHTFGRERCFAGVTYPELISSIVRSALERPR
jgi:D-alanine-D-alanine ligase